MAKPLDHEDVAAAAETLLRFARVTKYRIEYSQRPHSAYDRYYGYEEQAAALATMTVDLDEYGRHFLEYMTQGSAPPKYHRVAQPIASTPINPADLSKEEILAICDERDAYQLLDYQHEEEKKRLRLEVEKASLDAQSNKRALEHERSVNAPLHAKIKELEERLAKYDAPPPEGSTRWSMLEVDE